MKRILAVAVFSLLAVSSARADGMYLGLGAGAGSVSDGGGWHFTTGLRGGMKVDPAFSLGLAANYMNLGSYGVSAGNASVTASVWTWNLLAEGNYHFDALPGLTLGAKAGITSLVYKVSVNAFGLTASDTNTETAFTVGPALAYDYMVSDGFTVGPEVNWLFIMGDTDFNVLNTVLNFKYWF